MRVYLKKWRGCGDLPPTVHTPAEILLAFVSSFTGILILAALHFTVLPSTSHPVQLIAASFGATAVLVYAVPTYPVSQPYNVVVGNAISAVIGVTAALILPRAQPLAAAIAVAVSVAAMLTTNSAHPSGLLRGRGGFVTQSRRGDCPCGGAFSDGGVGRVPLRFFANNDRRGDPPRRCDCLQQHSAR